MLKMSTKMFPNCCYNCLVGGWNLSRIITLTRITRTKASVGLQLCFIFISFVSLSLCFCEIGCVCMLAQICKVMSFIYSVLAASGYLLLHRLYFPPVPLLHVPCFPAVLVESSTGLPYIHVEDSFCGLMYGPVLLSALLNPTFQSTISSC